MTGPKIEYEKILEWDNNTKQYVTIYEPVLYHTKLIDLEFTEKQQSLDCMINAMEALDK